jgi:hypothetical protein
MISFFRWAGQRVAAKARQDRHELRLIRRTRDQSFLWELDGKRIDSARDLGFPIFGPMRANWLVREMLPPSELTHDSRNWNVYLDPAQFRTEEFEAFVRCFLAGQREFQRMQQVQRIIYGAKPENWVFEDLTVTGARIEIDSNGRWTLTLSGSLNSPSGTIETDPGGRLRLLGPDLPDDLLRFRDRLCKTPLDYFDLPPCPPS